MPRASASICFPTSAPFTVVIGSCCAAGFFFMQDFAVGGYPPTSVVTFFVIFNHASHQQLSLALTFNVCMVFVPLYLIGIMNSYLPFCCTSVTIPILLFVPSVRFVSVTWFSLTACFACFFFLLLGSTRIHIIFLRQLPTG